MKCVQQNYRLQHNLLLEVNLASFERINVMKAIRECGEVSLSKYPAV